MEEYLSMEEGIIVRNWKKESLKLKLLNIAIVDEEEPDKQNQQTEPKQCKSDAEEIVVRQNLEIGHRNNYVWK